MDSNITLWQFLLELLVKDQHKHIISWTSNEGEFKLINAEEVAKLWGLRKNKHNMNYDKLSRALRYYYEKNIIKKVMGQKFVYRFVSFPEIVKTENKIPFKVKMESIAHEYGQRVMPHFASFNAQNIKSSAQNARPTDLSTKSSSSKTSHRPNRDSSDEPRAKIAKRDREVLKIRVDSPVPSPSSSASRSAASSPQPTTSSPTSSIVSKPKPSPISLDSSLMSHLATSSSYLPIPLSPAKISPFKFAALPTPLMVPSPMMGPRAPLLHFWSSLSPVTTMSPRFGPAFQFPGFFNAQIPFPPVTINSTSTMENLATPGVPSPTRTIQVP